MSDILAPEQGLRLRAAEDPLSLWIIPACSSPLDACNTSYSFDQREFRWQNLSLHVAGLISASLAFSVLLPFLSLACCHAFGSRDTVCLFRQQVHFLCLLQSLSKVAFFHSAYMKKLHGAQPQSQAPGHPIELRSSLLQYIQVITSSRSARLYERSKNTPCIHTSRVDG